MDTLFGLAFSLFFGFVPMFFFAWLVYWTDRYEKEPKLLLVGSFLWGVLIAAGGAFLINTVLGIGVYIFTESETATNLATGSIIAPIIEESLKGLAVLLVFLFFRKEFDSILDGIVYAAITAIGFAATENAYYIYSYGFSEGGFGGGLFLVFVRVILVGWQHPFYTAFIGIGLAMARLNHSAIIRIMAPFTGWVIAVIMHAIHNTLSNFITGLGGLAFSTLMDWGGWFLMFLFILWAIYREKRWITLHLQEEVHLGVISPGQYRVACSAWEQSSTRLGAFFSGQYAATHRFYQTCAELAHKKQQLASLGEEGGNSLIIQSLREELSSLSPRAAS
jgi:protease PrsW